MALLSKILQYNLQTNIIKWIQTLAVESDAAVKHINTLEQQYHRVNITKNTEN